MHMARSISVIDQRGRSHCLPMAAKVEAFEQAPITVLDRRIPDGTCIFAEIRGWT